MSGIISISEHTKNSRQEYRDRQCNESSTIIKFIYDNLIL
jgi:hypothetical protein